MAQKPAQKGTIINILNNLTSVNESISCPMSVNGEPEKDFVSKILPKTFNLELANPIQTMTLEDGSVYGFVNNGKIYLNPDLMNSKDAVHEYTHLWDAYTQKTNPELWNKGLKIFKDTKYWNEVISDPNYQDIKEDESLVLSEIHARYSKGISYLMYGETKKEHVYLFPKDFVKNTFDY